MITFNWQLLSEGTIQWALIGLAIMLLWLRFPPKNTPTLKFLLSKPLGMAELLCIVLLMAIGFWLKIHNLDLLGAGKLSPEERTIGIYNIRSLLTDLSYRAGIMHAVHVTLLLYWYKIFGYSALDARLFSVFLSCLGLLCYFGVVKEWFGARVAAWSVAIMSNCIYAVYFSKLAIEAGSILFWIPLELYILTRWIHNPHVTNSVSLGLSLALGSFTYPGFIPGWLSIIISACIIYFYPSTFIKDFFLKRAAATTISSITFLSFFLPLVYVQIFKLSNADTIFSGGGGGLSLSLQNLVFSAAVLLTDIFYDGISYYLYYSQAPFVDRATLPLAFFGIQLLLRESPQLSTKGVVLSLLLCPILVLFCGNYPGMRRAVFIFLPLSLCIAIGIVRVLESSKNKLILFLLLISLLHNPYYLYKYAPIDEETHLLQEGADFWRSINQ